MTYNVFGREAGDYATARSQLEWAGLHASDPRTDFAERSLQTASPGKRQATLACFACNPRPVSIPIGDGYSAFDTWFDAEPMIAPLLSALEDTIASGGPGFASLPRFWAGVMIQMHALLIERKMDPPGFMILCSMLPGKSGALDIVCLPQAFVLAVSIHANHRAAAVEWLTPHVAWLRTWLMDWPAFAIVFIEARRKYADLPNWLES